MRYRYHKAQLKPTRLIWTLIALECAALIMYLANIENVIGGFAK